MNINCEANYKPESSKSKIKLNWVNKNSNLKDAFKMSELPEKIVSNLFHFTAEMSCIYIYLPRI